MASGTVKKPHICPPSDAKHPSDRWESLFVYSFIMKFTNLRTKIEAFETPMDLENALLSREPDDILAGVLSAFIRNLKPGTRNLSVDQISSTVASVLAEYFKTPERTVFWDESLQKNVDPFETLEGGIFASDWDFKLKVLRQLVELQLTHSAEIKSMVDNAWGVIQQKNKNKKKDDRPPTLDPDDPRSQKNLQLIPLGQDINRKRYWITDDSPRVFQSSNPWKMSCAFSSISSTREEYVALVEKLKASAPQAPKGKQRMSKFEHGHHILVQNLEGRLEAVDTELARVARARKKVEQRRILQAQAEMRQTRTRRQTAKATYVYDDFAEENGDDDYNFQDDEEDYEMDEEGYGGSSSRRASSSLGVRRSGRQANARKRSSSLEWRGERRSARLGATDDMQFDEEPPRKRARTDESSLSTATSDAGTPAPSNDHNGAANGVRVKTSGAAKLKENEVVLEELPGKKKSKNWYYVVEPAAAGQVDPGPAEIEDKLAHVHVNGQSSNGVEPSRPFPNGKGEI